MSEEIDWKSRAEAAELLNEEYRIQLLMADKISGEQRSRAEAAEAEVEKWKSDWHKYKTRLERTDCRNAGEFYEMGGSHCPLDRPCDRCEWEREERRIQAEVARLTQQLDDLGHRYAGVESSLHGANARIAELEAACVIPDSGGHLESADCWCGPTVEEHPGGTLVIHNQIH